MIFRHYGRQAQQGCHSVGGQADGGLASLCVPGGRAVTQTGGFAACRVGIRVVLSCLLVRGVGVLALIACVLDGDDLPLVVKDYVGAGLLERPRVRVCGQDKVLLRAEGYRAINLDVAGDPLLGDWGVEVLLSLQERQV